MFHDSIPSINDTCSIRLISQSQTGLDPKLLFVQIGVNEKQLQEPQPSLTTPASTARSNGATIVDKLTFPNEPTSDEPTSDEPTSDESTSDESTSDERPSDELTSTYTIKREEKEKPRHIDRGQGGGQE